MSAKLLKKPNEVDSKRIILKNPGEMVKLSCSSLSVLQMEKCEYDDQA